METLPLSHRPSECLISFFARSFSFSFSRARCTSNFLAPRKAMQSLRKFQQPVRQSPGVASCHHSRLSCVRSSWSRVISHLHNAGINDFILGSSSYRVAYSQDRSNTSVCCHVLAWRGKNWSKPTFNNPTPRPYISNHTTLINRMRPTQTSVKQVSQAKYLRQNIHERLVEETTRYVVHSPNGPLAVSTFGVNTVSWSKMFILLGCCAHHLLSSSSLLPSFLPTFPRVNYTGTFRPLGLSLRRQSRRTTTTRPKRPRWTLKCIGCRRSSRASKRSDLRARKPSAPLRPQKSDLKMRSRPSPSLRCVTTPDGPTLSRSLPARLTPRDPHRHRRMPKPRKISSRPASCPELQPQLRPTATVKTVWCVEQEMPF